MSRPRKFADELIVAAAIQQAARHGPAAASIAAIGKAAQAPTGSIYHRFGSRSTLFGQAWLQVAAEFQTGFLRHFDGSEARSAGLDAALWVPQFVRQKPDHARVLLLFHRRDFLDDQWPEPLKAAAAALEEQMATGLQQFCLQLCGQIDAQQLRIVRFALADVPLAAVRPHLHAGEPLPEIIDDLVRAGYAAALSLLES